MDPVAPLSDLKDYMNAGAFGLLVLVLAALYRGGVVAGRCIGARLFHEETGLITMWVKSQQAFVESVQSSNEATHHAIERNTDSVLSLCSVLRRVCRDRIGVDADEEIDRVETMIRDAKERPPKPAT